MSCQLGKPDWSILINFGLPVNPRQETHDTPGYVSVVQQIINAAKFLSGTDDIPHNSRYYDSFKALLLALKIHYPSEFRKIENSAGMDFVKSFELDNISGRHIKLRNIALSLISSYYRNTANR